MVKRLFCILLLLAPFLFAAESKDLAFRAEKAMQAGKFARSNSLYERALLSSRKEADLSSEGRILIAMATLRTQSLDFKFAEGLLGQVRKESLDTNSLAALNLARMELFNGQEKFPETIRVWNSLSKRFLDHVTDPLRGNLLCAAAVAFAAKGDRESAMDLLEDADDYLDDDAPGKLAFAAARVEHLLGGSSADSLYGVALKYSISSGRPYMSATILYYRGLCSKRSSIAEDYFVRSANAFDLMGLTRNKERSGSHIKKKN
ncbi:MAG: hypothetical protein M0P13_05240 [Fibrobacteraceae bacterium]|nr:hypothetical protein [Fibrobacteraceae bacterium]